MTDLPINVKQELEGLRGKDYYDRWADIWKNNLQHVKAEVETQRGTGDFKVKHLVRICDAHDLPFKPFVTQLEKENFIPTGTFDKMPPLKKLREEVHREEKATHQ